VAIASGDFLQVQVTTANAASATKWKTYVVIG
jgi:hypothetical protein